MASRKRVTPTKAPAKAQGRPLWRALAEATEEDSSLVDMALFLSKQIEIATDALLQNQATDPQRENVRLLIRAWCGIPDQGGEPGPVLVLLLKKYLDGYHRDLSEFARAARKDSADDDARYALKTLSTQKAGTLRGRLIALDRRFLRVPLKSFLAAITPSGKRERPPTLQQAARLVVEAKLSGGRDLAGLIRATKHLRWQSARAGVWRDH